MELHKTLCAFLIALHTINASAQEGSWSNLFGGSNGIHGSINTLVIDPNGNVYVGGDFSEAGGVQTNNIAFWNGVEWSSVGSGFNDLVFALEIDEEGNLYAGGRFTKSDTLTLNGIARWDGQQWHALGAGLEKEFDLGHSTAIVWDLEIDKTGNLFVGGDFTAVDNILTRGIAVWDGDKWEVPGGGVDKVVGCLDLTLDDVFAIHANDSGEVYIGGNFREVGGVVANGIAKWDGLEWSSLGEGVPSSCNSVLALAEYNGDVFVGGSFSEVDGVEASGIARWTGSTWDGLNGGVLGDSGSVFAFASGIDGLYVGGRFVGAVNSKAGNIAQWTDEGWKMLGMGISSPGFPYAIAVYQEKVYVGGFLITEAGGLPSFGLALWRNGQSVSKEKAQPLGTVLRHISIFPNPISHAAIIEIDIANSSKMKIQVYNLLGQLVSTVYEGYPIKGVNVIEWESIQLPAGVYIIRIQQDGILYSQVVTRISR